MVLDPWSMVRVSEHSIQSAFFCWCRMARNVGFKLASDPETYKKKLCELEGIEPVPELEWIHSIGNGATLGNDAKTRAIRGAKMKAEGMKAGIPDVFWPFKGGLYIEMKRTSGGVVSKEQYAFSAYASKNNFSFKICRTLKEAIDCVTLFYYT